MRLCLILVTQETKAEETAFLQDALSKLNVPHQLIDTSLQSQGVVWCGNKKLARISEIVNEVTTRLKRRGSSDLGALVAIGGGTGSDIALRIMADMPEMLPKVLISPLPFDPRPALAQTSVTLIHSVVDIEGLNPTLQSVFENAASMLAGLCSRPISEVRIRKTIGLSALSATGRAAEQLIAGLKKRGKEVTVFHANGFGGAGFARFTRKGAFQGIIDMTCHELTRMLFLGDHVSMPDRFTAAGQLPRVILPGGLNFLGLGPLENLNDSLRLRPYFRHSSNFTHVKVTEYQMIKAAQELALALNCAEAPTRVIVPMGGFSHRDCPGGEIEDPELRNICLDTLSHAAHAFGVESIPHHINAPETANVVIETLCSLIKD
ncbi:MAG: Tm-1-like ATP-binding domain-containing protein [Aestuariivita sp.]|nr:Tm-1-like ATP-binding domain-containing protein [Aestuariivita sp.]